MKRCQKYPDFQVDALFDVLPLTWSCWKRLYELRENLYEPVKDVGPDTDDTDVRDGIRDIFETFSRHVQVQIMFQRCCITSL